MVRLATIIVLLMCMLNLIPPLFASGGVFDVVNVSVDDCGNLVINRGLLFDNVYYSILYLLLSFLGLSLPFLVVELHKPFKMISTLIGAWFIAGLVNGLINMVVPDIVINNSHDKAMYLKFLLTFTITITFIVIESIWSNQKN